MNGRSVRLGCPGRVEKERRRHGALEEQYAHMELYLKPLLDDSWEMLDANVKIERFRLSCLERAPHLMDTWDRMDRVGKTAWATALAYCELAIRRDRQTHRLTDPSR